ncbi:MAG TPA: nucleoside monophosphate kinase [Candidatus Limnocylindria bacterium]|nr:nucleoside monophosphate kinase [Candidatus Limnocylindria bacterium]
MTLAGSSPETPGASPAGDRRILLLVGAVGAGKGTQAGILAERLGLAHLASGDLFRRALSERTPIGLQAKGYMDRGELVPDDVTIAIFMDELAKPAAARGAVLDGFPRTVAQAEALDATLGGRGERLTGVFYIDVPTEELVARVAGRWVCPVDGTPYHLVTDPPREPGICDKDGARLVQRDDDRPEVVRARLAKQVPPMLEVLDHYRQAGIVTHVDGRGPIDEVTRQILQALGAQGEGS